MEEHVLRVFDESGAGWLFAVYERAGSDTRLVLTGTGEVVAERTAAADEPLSVSLLVAPLSGLGTDEIALYSSPGSVQVERTLLDRDGVEVGEPGLAEWDELLGAYRVDLPDLQTAGAPRRPDFEDEQFDHWYGRHRLSVDLGELSKVSLPLAFYATARISWGITGGVAILRDQRGSPLGVPVQMSKNWHGVGNVWYRLYSQPTVSSDDPMELTIASVKWGESYVASHAQLSLVGWSTAGGHWDESALACWGESVTYDPDVTLRRAMMDDVRPFLVLSERFYNWTGNVGGADFLRYRAAGDPNRERRLGRVRSRYESHGPNLTDVTYSGVSSDGAIRADIRTQLGSTDDLVRVYYTFEYEFLADVEYSRLAFFQVAADNYGDNDFAGLATGNESGVMMEYDRPAEAPATGYDTDDDRGIALPGESPWVLLSRNQRVGGTLPEEFADVGFVVREYEARVGDAVLTTPHINIHQLNDSIRQASFEVGLPDEPDSAWCGAPCGGRARFVPAGSTVRFTLEYLVIPASKVRYYGPDPFLLSAAVEDFGTPAMMRLLAAGNALSVEAHVGTVESAYPVRVAAEPGVVAAEFTVVGGRGFTPLTVAGLVRHDGWTLELQDGAGWVPFDASSEGRDYWQTEFDPSSATYALTFSVRNGLSTRYRLAWDAE